MKYDDLLIQNQLSKETKIYFDEYISTFDKTNKILFPITDRAVQKKLKLVCDYLGYKDVGIHSFRKLSHLKEDVFNIIGLPKEEMPSLKTNISGVYSIRCKKNGRIYIGESKDIEIRWCQHKEDLKYHVHHSKLLQEDYDKYGRDAFVWSVLGEYKTEKERKDLEHNYIHALGTIQYGYNTAS